MLESQAERSEGLENCWQRAREIGGSIKTLARPGGSRRVRALGGSIQPRVAAQRHAAFHRGNIQQAVERLSARLDIHLGNLIGQRRFFPLHRRDGLECGVDHRAVGLLGKPVRFRQPGVALCARRPARSEQPGIYRRGGESRAAGVEGQPWARIFPVHQPAGDAARARAAAGGIRTANGSTIRYCCKARARARTCWSVSATWATRC